jgi:hypothetical protein
MSNPGPSWLDANKYAAQDRTYSYANQTITITIGGLDGPMYDIEVVASKSGTEFVGSYELQYGAGQTSKVDDFSSRYDGYDGGEWLSWSSIAPDSADEIVLVVEREAVNAMRILEVPEPATMALLGIGTLGVTVLRRRRRH